MLPPLQHSSLNLRCGPGNATKLVSAIRGWKVCLQMWFIQETSRCMGGRPHATAYKFIHKDCTKGIHDISVLRLAYGHPYEAPFEGLVSYFAFWPNASLFLALAPFCLSDHLLVELQGHLTNEPGAVTLKSWEPKWKCPKAVPTQGAKGYVIQDKSKWLYQCSF